MTEDTELSTSVEDMPFVVGLQVRPYNWFMRQARKEKGFTQKDLATLVGCPISHIWLLESLNASRDKFSWDELVDIADALEQSVDRLFPAWFVGSAVKEILSGDLPIPLQKAAVLSGTDVIQGVVQASLLLAMQAALQHLLQRERLVLTARFGLDGSEPKTLAAIGRILGCTGDNVRQIEATALCKLRYSFYGKNLKEYL